MAIRELLKKDLDKLKNIPDINIETIVIYGTKPVIKIDEIMLDTDYKNYKQILEDLKNKLDIKD